MFKKLISFFADTVQTIVVAGIIFVAIYAFLFQPHEVIGDSMFPNFKNNEFVITDKVSYRLRDPERGEVIVFKSPSDEEKDYIKRIIAQPSEKIKIEKGKIFINGEELDEAGYLAVDTRTFPGVFAQEGKELQVPQGSYFVVGDNRSNSSDSRDFGFVKKGSIIGRSFLVYWPPGEFRIVKF